MAKLVKSNNDVRKAATLLFHRLIETKEIEIGEAIAGVKLLDVIQKCHRMDATKQMLGIDYFPSETDELKDEGSMFIKKIGN